MKSIPPSAASAQIRAWTIRPLASPVQSRIPGYPNVPTVAESDRRLAGYDVYTWSMLVAPKATPDAVVNRLNEVALAAARAPEIALRLSELGFAPIHSSPAEGDAFLAREQQKWGALIRNAGIRSTF